MKKKLVLRDKLIECVHLEDIHKASSAVPGAKENLAIIHNEVQLRTLVHNIVI